MGIRKAIAALLMGLIDYALETRGSSWRYAKVSEIALLEKEIDNMFNSLLKDLTKLERSMPRVSPRIEAPRAVTTSTPSVGGSSEAEKSGFSSEEARKYTLERTIEHLVAVEDHLRSAHTDFGVCIGCLMEHHFPALSMYSKEGLKFGRDPEECESYKELGRVVEEAKQMILSGNFKPEELAEKFRSVRKKLSPAGRVVKQLIEKMQSTQQQSQQSEFKTFDFIKIVPFEDCTHEVRQYVEKLAPKVVKTLAKRGFRLEPIELEIQPGVPVIDRKEAAAATNPDVSPKISVFNCRIWRQLPPEMKERIVAHELAHAFGVRDETTADTIALEALAEKD